MIFMLFFLVCMSRTTARGISIMNGGKPRKVTSSIDMKLLCNSFDSVLSGYLRVLSPLRIVQEQISSSLMELGFSGNIHGCIVDIDFYHHVMVNPYDGTFTYYYSPTFGTVRVLNCFADVLKSVKSNSLLGCFNWRLINKLYKSHCSDDNYVLCRVSNSEFPDLPVCDMDVFYSVSRTDGIYGVSRKIAPLQHLFDRHVLCDFDFKLAGSKLLFD